MNVAVLVWLEYMDILMGLTMNVQQACFSQRRRYFTLNTEHLLLLE